MHSMYLAGVPSPWSMLRQPIHFAPGAIPIWLRPIIADRGAYGVGAVDVVIARHEASRCRNCRLLSWMAVVPVVVVIGRDSVPAAVVRLERVMRPPNAGIGAWQRRYPGQ